ncbi:MAG: hypothetical protein LBT08_04405 [Synergistaceae bacterium]|nr:hypothetical protein [Synergistaceae bacterium]
MRKASVIFFCIVAAALTGYGMYTATSGSQTASAAAVAETPAAETEPAAAQKTDIFEIREKMFIEQCNDIYLNTDEYEGRTVRLEGMYDEYEDEETGETYRYVIRLGPGCCGNDGVAGFEFTYGGDTAPKQDDWIEATGTVEAIGPTEDGNVILRLSSLRVMEERGAEYVSN